MDVAAEVEEEVVVGATRVETVAAIETLETDETILHHFETIAAESATGIGGIVTEMLFAVGDHHQVLEDPRLAEIFEIATFKSALRLTELDVGQETADLLARGLRHQIRPLHHSRIEVRDFEVVAVDEAAVTGTAEEDVPFMKTDLIALEVGLKKDAGVGPETGTTAITIGSWTLIYGHAIA